MIRRTEDSNHKNKIGNCIFNAILTKFPNFTKVGLEIAITQHEPCCSFIEI